LVIGHWSFVALPAAQACVGCREPGSETLNHENPTVMAGFAFSWSVLFMLIAALAVVGFLSAYIWQTCQRLDRERARS
jgi:cbb3-type cytochrome oxidase subunit 3